MRTHAIVVLLLAGLAGLSVLPSAAAIPPVCLERDVQQGPVGAGYSTCYDEYVEVVNCSNGGPQGVHYFNDLGPAYVRVDYCLPHMPPPSMGSASAELPTPCGPTERCAGPECPSRTVASEVDHHNSITLNRDCTVDIVTGRGQICVGAWTGHSQHTVGPVTWDRYYCTAPGGGPLELTSAASTPGPCGVSAQRCPAPVPPCSGVDDDLVASGNGPLEVMYDLSPNCHLDVYVKADVMDCLWGEGYNKALEQGPVTVWTWGCRPYPVE